jgi:cytosolic nonspecific dipeptidase
LLSHIDVNKIRYIDLLREAVAIKSVSAWPQARPDCQRMIDFAEKKLKGIGATVEQVDIGNQTLPDGTILKLPNVILGILGNVSYHNHSNI